MRAAIDFRRPAGRAVRPERSQRPISPREMALAEAVFLEHRVSMGRRCSHVGGGRGKDCHPRDIVTRRWAPVREPDARRRGGREVSARSRGQRRFQILRDLRYSVRDGRGILRSHRPRGAVARAPLRRGVGPSRQYDLKFQYRIRFNRFRIRAEQTQIRPMSLSALCFRSRRSTDAADSAHPSDEAAKKTKTKVQAICNGKCDPITMQGIAPTREKPPAQEQWVSMGKQCE